MGRIGIIVILLSVFFDACSDQTARTKNADGRKARLPTPVQGDGKGTGASSILEAPETETKSLAKPFRRFLSEHKKGTRINGPEIPKKISAGLSRLVKREKDETEPKVVWLTALGNDKEGATWADFVTTSKKGSLRNEPTRIRYQLLKCLEDCEVYYGGSFCKEKPERCADWFIQTMQWMPATTAFLEKHKKPLLVQAPDIPVSVVEELKKIAKKETGGSPLEILWLWTLGSGKKEDNWAAFVARSQVTTEDEKAPRDVYSYSLLECDEVCKKRGDESSSGVPGVRSAAPGDIVDLDGDEVADAYAYHATIGPDGPSAGLVFLSTKAGSSVMKTVDVVDLKQLGKVQKWVYNVCLTERPKAVKAVNDDVGEENKKEPHIMVQTAALWLNSPVEKDRSRPFALCFSEISFNTFLPWAFRELSLELPDIPIQPFDPAILLSSPKLLPCEALGAVRYLERPKEIGPANTRGGLSAYLELWGVRDGRRVPIEAVKGREGKLLREPIDALKKRATVPLWPEGEYEIFRICGGDIGFGGCYAVHENVYFYERTPDGSLLARGDHTIYKLY